MPEPCIKSSTHRDNRGFTDWDDGSLALLYFLIRNDIRSFIVQKPWWRPSTPTLQPSNSLSAGPTTLAQRLPWLAQRHITYARTHTRTLMTSALWPLKARQRHTQLVTLTHRLTHFDISLSKEPVCTLPPTTIITFNTPL